MKDWESLAVQWLGVGASTARGRGSIPGRGTKIPQAMWCSQKKGKRKRILNLTQWFVKMFKTLVLDTEYRQGKRYSWE